MTTPWPSINGLYTTESTKTRKPCLNLDDVEFATAEWVDWYNHRRLYEYCGDIPPADLETSYYDSQAVALHIAGLAMK